MVLIFGGTTEGRIAIDVCEEAGTPFYYSTKGSQQEVMLHHGVRLHGAKTAGEIRQFCLDHDIRCIIDAAHPFAENLHNAIAEAAEGCENTGGSAAMHVIRLERQYPEDIEGVTYFDNYDEACRKMECERLLALSGVNTIAKLKDYWKNHITLFRILNRTESMELVRKAEFPASQLLFYPDHTPTVEEEMAMMKESDCDAILTKESGESGGFGNKIDAARRLGMKVYVVRRPKAKACWHIVTGPHTLRRTIERLVPDFFPLKTGLTTGNCATAAVKAALYNNKVVTIPLPDGELLEVECTVEAPGKASVVKDFSDDPDVTRGCKITAEVTLRYDAGNTGVAYEVDNNDASPCHDTFVINFLQGEGVGRVTLPGLGIPVDGPAINTTPREMMTKVVREFLASQFVNGRMNHIQQSDERIILSQQTDCRKILPTGCDITISVENGRELARQTFNPKVGVVDGISIIGSSGIVYPLSNDAFIRSIGRELEVAKAIGCTTIGFASGKKGENALKERYPDLRVIHYGNFIGEALKSAQRLGFEKAVVGIMIGKAVKLAEGHLDTHSHKVTMNKDFLKKVAADVGLSSFNSKIDSITIARELWDFMPQAFFDRITELCTLHCQRVFSEQTASVEVLTFNV